MKVNFGALGIPRECQKQEYRIVMVLIEIEPKTIYGIWVGWAVRMILLGLLRTLMLLGDLQRQTV